MRQLLSARRDDDGFTLIELLIVIIILAILAGIVVYAVGTTGANSLSASCSADAKSFQTALEEYKAVVGVYPGDVSLQVPGQANTQPLPNFGESWGINTETGLTLTGVYGLTGNPTSPGGTWTAPNGAVVGPFMRQLPSTQHYQIVTDGNGEVFVYPPLPYKPNTSASAMDRTNPHITVQNPEPGADLPVGSTTPDTSPLNFEEDPGICSDPNVVY